MTQTNKGLKQSKIETVKPSKAEVILSDDTKLALAIVTGEATKAFDLFAKQQDASVAYDTAEQALAYDLYQYFVDTKPDYPTYQAVKKHLLTSISTAKGRKYDTIEKWFNAKIVKALKELGFVLPKAESKNAESMAKLRAELASIDDAELVTQIAELAKAGDKDSLKRATQLATEKQKREAQAEKAIARSESKHTTELKGALKKWVTGMSPSELAVMLYVKNNFNEVTKLAKLTK